MFLQTALARVKIGDRFTYQTGDEYLVSCSVTSSEQERSSSCTITIYDPGLKITNLFLTEFQKVGGILIPKGLISDPNQQQTGGGSLSSSDAQGGLRGDDLARAIIKEADKQGMTFTPQIAYTIATAQHETDMGRITVEEGNRSYFNYLENRPELGNTRPGEGYRYRGRGSIQLTGKINYQKFSKILGVDLVKNPELAALPKYGIPILVYSMIHGTTTGRKLSQYVRPGKIDYVNARRVINALDKAQKIAGYARTWEKRIPLLRAPSLPPTSSNAGIPSGSSVFSNLPTTQQKEEKEINLEDGTLINIELGFNNFSPAFYQYILTDVRGRNIIPETLTVSGKQVRYFIAKGKKFYKIHQNITIKQISNQVAASVGAGLKLDTERGVNEVISKVQQQENDYDFLLKLAKGRGLFLRDSAKDLKIERLKESDGKIKIKPLVILPGSDWGDSANESRILKSDSEKKPEAPTPQVSQKPGSNGGQIPSSSEVFSDLAQNSTATIESSQSGILDLKQQFDDSKGIGKGFEGQLQLYTPEQPELLLQQPGTVLLLGDDSYGDAINREYRIEELTHNYSNQNITSNIRFYLPVAVEAKQSQSQNSTQNPAGKPSSSFTEAGQKPVVKGEKIGGGFFITSPFGYRVHPITKDRRMHNGIDVGKEGGGISGTPIYAAIREGAVRVRQFFDPGGGGNVAEYEIEDILIQCMHLIRALPGLRKAGEPIGYIGNTGSSTAAHLHLTQRIKATRKPVNPYREIIVLTMFGTKAT